MLPHWKKTLSQLWVVTVMIWSMIHHSPSLKITSTLMLGLIFPQNLMPWKGIVMIITRWLLKIDCLPSCSHAVLDQSSY